MSHAIRAQLRNIGFDHYYLVFHVIPAYTIDDLYRYLTHHIQNECSAKEIFIFVRICKLLTIDVFTNY